MSTANAALWIDSLVRLIPELTLQLASSGGRGPGQPVRRSAAGPAAPLRISVADTLAGVTADIVELEDAVRDRLGLPAAAPLPPVPRLRRIAALAGPIDRDPLLRVHVAEETRRLARLCARELGEPERIVRVHGRCRDCDSVSLRALPDRDGDMVLCINPACRSHLGVPV
ncbi:hypothetical protein ACIHCQ_00950 [Streptomyces sp. NPDC052236]|uniref:hypothetical protein n=1 Tax=Streptomyces sp. NPDC052236 TaxID=3365686 RepID=UPI0037D6DD07